MPHYALSTLLVLLALLVALLENLDQYYYLSSTGEQSCCVTTATASMVNMTLCVSLLVSSTIACLFGMMIDHFRVGSVIF